MHKLILTVICAISLGGCSTVNEAKQSVTQLGASLYAPSHYMSEEFTPRLNGLDRGKPIDSDGRAFLSDYLNKINHDYAVYIANLTSGKASLNVAYDSLNLGLTGAAAIASPVNTKTGLAALSTFFQGQKQSIDKNIFDDKAIFALTAIMEIRRTEVLSKIRRSLLSASYTLGDALLDLDEFYRAGTLQTALQASFLNQQRLEPPSPAPTGGAIPKPAPEPSQAPAYPSSTNPLK